jgi:pentalenene oxygenase
VVRTDIGINPAYVVTDPDLAQTVLVDSKTYEKGGRLFDALRAFFGNGLATADEESPKRQRRLMQPMFNLAHVATRVDPVIEHVQEHRGPSPRTTC